ncbi:MAG: hypothetical protein EKK54_04290 [Neisseriaceae bacterium]|nr:MAG: hypothetical protein EKK54_04290 [Neisseriaceae bacterium]
MNLKNIKSEKLDLYEYDFEAILLDLPIVSYPTIDISSELILYIFLAYHEKLSFVYIQHPSKKTHLHIYLSKINEIIKFTGLIKIENKTARASKRVFKEYDIIYKNQILQRVQINEEIRRHDYCVLRNLSKVINESAYINKLILLSKQDYYGNYLDLIINSYYYSYKIYTNFVDGEVFLSDWEKLEILLAKIFFELPKYLTHSKDLITINRRVFAASTTQKANQLLGIFNANLKSIALEVIRDYLRNGNKLEVFEVILHIMELDYNFINTYKKNNNVSHKFYKNYLNLEFSIYKKRNSKIEETDRFKNVYDCICFIILLYDSDLSVYSGFNQFKENVKLFELDYFK